MRKRGGELVHSDDWELRQQPFATRAVFEKPRHVDTPISATSWIERWASAPEIAAHVELLANPEAARIEVVNDQDQFVFTPQQVLQFRTSRSKA